MDVNYSNIYSILSLSEGKNQNNVEAVLDKIYGLEKCKTVESAKKYLKETYSLEDSFGQFYVNNEIPVNVHEDDKYFSVEINLKNEFITYCYQK